MNQVISYALITGVCLGLLLTVMPSVIKAFEEVESLVEKRSVLTVRSAVDEAIALSVGRGEGEVKVLTPVDVHIDCSGEVVRLSSRRAGDHLKLPFRISCAPMDLKGCFIIRSLWSEEGVVLTWRRC